jgi:hypothetical protein
VVSFTPRPLYPRERASDTHWIGSWVDPKAGLDDVEKRKFLTPPGLEIRPYGLPARSESLYRLRYPDCAIPAVYNGKYLLTDVIGSFLQPLRINAGIAAPLGHYRFLLNLLQFISKQSFHYSTIYDKQTARRFHKSKKLEEIHRWSRDSSVDIGTGYWLHYWGVEFRVPVRSRTFSSSRRPSNLLSNGYRRIFPLG